MDDWLKLALQLWPHAKRDELREELEALLVSPKAANFIVRTQAGEAVAFMNLTLRHDYVPGATESPVAYLEGIYVAEAFRKQGVAKELLKHAEAWAREVNCTELASDALLENTQSHAFHLASDFREIHRVVCFIKALT